MPKNIVIFSDGTGQRGGLLVDERRSNIYKLYRATRSGPDTSIAPWKQTAFYDPGLGTLPAGTEFFSGLWRGIYNLASQATGLGLTGNIIDCYAALVRLWEPGDRIFLFGFSRGAYTVRSLGGVLSLCGLPTRMKDGKPLKRDEASAKRIAREAVTKVYQHTSSRTTAQANTRQAELLAQRTALANRFREQYGSDQNGLSNAFPYFIGVFDTVASLANPVAVAGFTVAAVVGLLAASWVLSLFTLTFPIWLMTLGGLAALIFLIGYLRTHIKVAFGLPGHRWWKTFHFTEPRMKFYDKSLNVHVGFARHAIAIDERRQSFQRVAWGSPGIWRDTGDGNPEWFKQLWFAGNHSDIGGSYPEEESRLSDISLKWMVDEARAVGLQVDWNVLRLYPSSSGMQHDECKSSIFKYAGKIVRDPPHDAPLHPTVLERFELDAVIDYDEGKPYRPESLRNHGLVTVYYT